MNERQKAFPFIIHHSAFIISSLDSARHISYTHAKRKTAPAGF